MKAVIFNSSLKNKKYSNTYSWCKVLADKLEKNNIRTEVIDLKSFDYEASNGSGDLLYKEFKKVYGARLIIFASPVFLGQITFSMKHLLERFKIANERSKKAGIDLFKSKLFDTCIHFGSSIQSLEDGKEEVYVGPGRKIEERKYVYSYCHEYMKPIGFEDFYVSTKSPNDPTGFAYNDNKITQSKIAPDYKTMDKNEDVSNMIDQFISRFNDFQKDFHNYENPNCTKEQFAEFFKADNEYNFGKGWTLSIDRLNEENVKKHRELVKNSGADKKFIMQAWTCMKERCLTAGDWELSTEYYGEQFHVIADGFDRSGCSGNYRPNNY